MRTDDNRRGSSTELYLGSSPGIGAIMPIGRAVAGHELTPFAERTAAVDDARTTGVDERFNADAIVEPHLREAAAQSGRPQGCGATGRRWSRRR